MIRLFKGLSFPIVIFVIWKAILLLSILFANKLLPLAGRNFLGGGYNNYISNPTFWGWANFDGEHYLSIANIGYKGLEQAFFPIYPILINFFSKAFTSI